LDVNASSVEEGNTFNFSVAQDQRKFRAAENQSIDALTLLYLLDDRDQTLACFREENVVEQLAHVFFVDERSFILVGNDYVDSGCSEDFGIELCLHGKASAEQRRPLQVQLARSISRRLNDADHWE